MGCCESTPAVPDEILEDPHPNQRNVFVTKSCSMFNSDFEVFKNSEDPTNRWLFLNKVGKWGSDDCKILLENYVRGGNPEEPKQGQVLWSVTYDERPSYEFAYDSDSDSDDGFSWGDVFNVFGRDKYYSMKWKMKTTASFCPGTKGDQQYVIKCKAKGWCSRHIDYHRDADGQLHKTYEDKEEVKKISCKVYDSHGNQLDKFKVYTDDNCYSENIELDCLAFYAKKEGNWFSRAKTTIEAKPGAEPSMALLMAHLCLEEFSVNEIKNDCNPNWHRCPGYHD